MNRKALYLMGALLIFAHFSFAQSNRYMVFFTDKANSSYNLDDPFPYLSQRAIERRERYNIPVDESDLPVNKEYVDGIKSAGADVFYTSRWMNGALVQMDESQLNEVSELAFVTQVEYIAPGVKLQREQSTYKIPAEFDAPTDQFADSNLQLGMLNADDMHTEGYTGEGIIISVFDAGFVGVNKFKPFEHFFSEEKLIATNDFVYNTGNAFQYHDHGTEVVSCIAAKYDNFYGTAYDASFILAVTEDVKSEYRIEEYNWLLAAEFADSAGTDIIHSSLGYSVFGKEPSMNYEYNDLDGETAAITKAVNMAVDKGIIVVTSAGNEGNSSWEYITAPADAENILAVGSVNDEYQKSSFSSVGPTADGRIKPDVMALGSGTTIMTGGGTITYANGTSYAAPLVAGLAAGIWQANPDWTHLDVINAIKYTSSRALVPNSLYGHGVPNYKVAVTGAVLSIDQIVNRDLSVYPNPFNGNTISIDMRSYLSLRNLTFTVFDAKGSVLLKKQVEVPEEVINLEVPNLNKGTYFLKINATTFSKTVKLIKN